MADDDSNSCFEFISSQGEKQTFSKVPELTIYKFKIISQSKHHKFGYKLMEGTDLPCVKDVGGILILVG